jgi:CheY-like chemotaxis protein
VAATGASYLVGDVSTDPHYLPGAANARSSLTVPIIEKKQVIGTFNVESDKPDHYTSADREFLEVFVGEIAQAIGQLELLQAESQRGRAATAREVLAVAVVPADEIFAEASRLAEAIPSEATEARETARKVLSHARILKNALRRVGANIASGERAPTTSLAGKRVLFADTDPELRTTAHQLLGVLGCDVETVGEAAEAIALARSEGYDVLVADINLPDLDGYELFMKIKSESPRTATVLMTGFGYDKGHILVRATQAGLKAKLFKPFRVDRLAEAIEDALEIKREQPSMLLGAERREII